jgi:hypothetical protein
MFEERFESNGEEYLIVGEVNVLDDHPGFSVQYKITSSSRIELDLELRFMVTSLIGLDDIVILGASGLGFCVAKKLTKKTAKEAIKCYRKSKKDNPNLGPLEHAKAAGACVANNGMGLKNAVTDALIDCISLPKDDDDDADD